MTTDILVIGGSNSQPAQSGADFFDMWSDRFTMEVVKPDPWDWVAAGAGVYTAGIGAVAVRGLTREVAITTGNAYQLGVEVPLTVGMGIPAVAQGAMQPKAAQRGQLRISF